MMPDGLDKWYIYIIYFLEIAGPVYIMITSWNLDKMEFTKDGKHVNTFLRKRNNYSVIMAKVDNLLMLSNNRSIIK